MIPKRQVVEDAKALARAGADRVISAAKQALASHGGFSLVLSGGSTPKALYALLAENERGAIDWSRVEIFFGDERCVPPEHQDSNYRMAREAMLAHLPLREEQIYRIRGEADAADAAEEYERILRGRGIGAQNRFDLVLLGMGADGHTASLFPETDALDAKGRLVAANYVEKLAAWRVTLTYEALLAARAIVFLIGGADKAAVLKDVLFGEEQPRLYPSQKILRAEAPVELLVDKAAAAKLT
jgi:6-phosphogluconolactonase